jgi:hypothetical protein
MHQWRLKARTLQNPTQNVALTSVSQLKQHLQAELGRVLGRLFCRYGRVGQERLGKHATRIVHNRCGKLRRLGNGFFELSFPRPSV